MVSSRAPANGEPSCCAWATSSATSACASCPSTGSLISGVATLSGSSASTSDGDSSRWARISSNRAAAYRPSSKPYQRSLKKKWPLISPASSASVSRIFALISECPVFHTSGLPPLRST
ncbi:hypothetical protein NB689_003450 [Xanthomonas sacchari]|nr:hypothetical protein [Xanthomonas sacchari]